MQTPEERFAAIQAKEAELQRREEALRQQNIEVVQEKPPNFPPFFHFVHHDISTDIPIAYQMTVKIAFVLFLLTCVTLIMNLIACFTTGTIKVGKGTSYSLGTNSVLGVIYLLLTVPLAFKINYYRLYEQCMKKNIKMTWFALEGIYIGVYAYASAGMKNTGCIGLITTIDSISAGSGASKAFCTISCIMWLLGLAGHVFLFGKVMNASKVGESNNQYSAVLQ